MALYFTPYLLEFSCKPSVFNGFRTLAKTIGVYGLSLTMNSRFRFGKRSRESCSVSQVPLGLPAVNCQLLTVNCRLLTRSYVRYDALIRTYSAVKSQVQ